MTTDANFVVKKGLNVQDGDISLKGSNKELRFYEGSNYVGFEAPALTADKIWVLPAADGSTGQVLKTDGSGNLGWVSGGDTNAGGVNGSASAVTFGFTSDTDTGMYRVGAGLLGFTSNGQRKLQVDPYGITVGDGNSAGYISSEGTQDLILRTNDGTNSGVITLHDSANGDINIAPNGTGSFLVNYSTSNNTFGTQVASNANNVVPFSSTNKTTSTNAIQTTAQFTNAITSGSRTTGFGSQIEFRLGEINYAGYLAGKIGAKMKDTGNANFDMFITPEGTGNVSLGNFTLDADQTVGSGQDNYVMTYDHSAGTIGLEAAAGGGASSLNDLSDVVVSNTSNLGIGTDVFGSINTNNSTAVGYRAGQDLTTGSNNVLLGSNAGANLTVGQDNIAIGRNTMGNDTASIHAIAIGSQTGEHSTGDYNISLGSYAGRWLTGHYNINIGKSANDSGSNTGSGNVVIGNNQDLADDTTDRNLIIAGNDGTNTTTWITGNSSGVVTVPNEVFVGTGTNPLNNAVVTIVNDDSDTKQTLLLVDNESDTSNGPVFTMYRNSASPADGDILGKIQLNGEDSAGNPRAYGSIRQVSTDVTDGTHDGTMYLNVAIGGTQTDVVSVDGTGGYGGLTHNPSGIKTLGNVVSATSTANNGYITLLAVPHANFKAIKASIHITDSTSNEVQTMDLVCHYDGSNANYTTYGIIYDGAAAIGDVEVDINSSNIRIRFQNTQGSTVNLAGSIHAVCHP